MEGGDIEGRRQEKADKTKKGRTMAETAAKTVRIHDEDDEIT